METEVRRGARVAMFVVVLLGFSALGYGVAAATGSLQHGSGGSDSTHVKQVSAPDPSATPVTTTQAQPSPKPSPKPKPKPKPKPTPVQPKAGPALLKHGDHGAEVRELQARLRQIAWFSGDVTDTYGDKTTEAVRGFQAKRGIAVTGAVDQETLDRLHAMTHEPSTAELENRLTPMGNAPGPLDARCTTGRTLCIDKSSRTLRWVVDGKVLKTVDVRFGSTLNDTPTREGLFHVYWMDADHVSKEFGSAMPFSMFFSGGQAVHYSSDFSARGYAGASHGCVNVRDYDGVKWLYEHVRVGDKVVVYWS